MLTFAYGLYFSDVQDILVYVSRKLLTSFVLSFFHYHGNSVDFLHVRFPGEFSFFFNNLIQSSENFTQV